MATPTRFRCDPSVTADRRLAEAIRQAGIPSVANHVGIDRTTLWRWTEGTGTLKAAVVRKIQKRVNGKKGA